MAIVDIPKSPDDLSPEWLTAALQSGGAGNARVASFDYEPIAAGVGFLASSAGCAFAMPRVVRGCRERSLSSSRPRTRNRVSSP
jgi:hypothetical protein